MTKIDLNIIKVDKYLKELNSTLGGLSQFEAHKRLLQYGLNSLGTKNQIVLIKNLLDQFTDFLVIILLIAGILSLVLGDRETATVMFAVVGINAAIGFWQQYKTERTLAELKKLIPHHSRVLRDNRQREINSQYLVPGDVIILQAGDAVPADGIIIECYNFKINEASLTGESLPQTKHQDPQTNHPKINLVFMGTGVLEGEAKVLIFSTGIKTAFGQIAQKTKETKDDLSPLQKRLRKIGRRVAVIAGSIMIGIIAWEIIRNYYFLHQPLEIDSTRKLFLFALGLAASLVPEGLPATISVALSIGARRLIKKKALVKRLSSVETLGSTNVICTDKTGTLTMGKMSVIVAQEKNTNAYQKLADFNYQKNLPMIDNWILNGNVEKTDQGLVGDPDEKALLEAAKKLNFAIEKVKKEYQRIYEFSFTSQRKMMSVLVEKNGKSYLFSKGSPEIILSKCQLDKKEFKRELTNINKMAGEGLRVFAFGHRDFTQKPANFKAEKIEKELIFDGIVGIQDDIHEEVPEAVRYCHQAGIYLVMLTGDYQKTAEAVAKKIGLAEEGKFRMISGEELEKMTDLELRENLLHPLVFYQTNPQDKLRIVETLQKMGKIIAVTGDGVNDALALKKADIGVAMGRIGTDVAKEAADMILLDDNFATIVKAIKEGRIIWDNLRKFLFYIFSSNAGEFITVFLGTIFALPMPILAVQILSVDLGTDVLPSLALVADPAGKNILQQNISQREDLLGKPVLLRLFYVGLIMGGGAALSYWLINASGPDDTLLYQQATTAAFATLVVCQIVNVFESRGGFSSFQEAIFSNRYLLLSVLAEIIILLLIVYWQPLQAFLFTQAFPVIYWIPIIMVGLIFLTVEEIRKKYQKKQARSA